MATVSFFTQPPVTVRYHIYLEYPQMQLKALLVRQTQILI